MTLAALLLEYHGGGFVGWQRQETGPSVQAALEQAAAPLNGGAPGAAQAAGRTDSGVHASGQVVGLTVSADLPPARLREALNARLRPLPVSVLAAARPPEGWSARFSATLRLYRYRILDRRPPPALLAGLVWHLPRRLDEAAMAEAARPLLGRHDFSAFRASACQASGPVRTLDRLEVRREGEEVWVEAEARSFLHHQVRNLVGTLAEVGLGRRRPAWPAEVLAGRDRRRAGPTAPPEGLCLTGVRYEPPLAWEDPRAYGPGS